MALAASRTVAVVNAPEEILFQAVLPAARLREMALSAKAVSDTVFFEVRGDSDAPFRIDGKGAVSVRYWGMDDDRICTMVGQPSPSIFESIGGDGETHTVQVNVVHLLQKVAALDTKPKRTVEFALLRQGKQHAFSLRQARLDDDEPDYHKMSVLESDAKPTVPIIGKGAYAGVNLPVFNRVLAGLKKNTNIVTLTVKPGVFEVTTSTRRLQDMWTHATTTEGTASGIYSTAFLKKVVAGAEKVSDLGEIYLVNGQPLHVSAVTEKLTVDFYVMDSVVASRDA